MTKLADVLKCFSEEAQNAINNLLSLDEQGKHSEFDAIQEDVCKEHHFDIHAIMEVTAEEFLSNEMRISNHMRIECSNNMNFAKGSK
jgi:hypothetical protein